MTIYFLTDYTVGEPPEVFTMGEVRHDRDAASELHFVRRGKAAYLAEDGVLTDHEGAVIGQLEEPPKAPPKPKPPKAPPKIEQEPPPAPTADTPATEGEGSEA